ncbi:MAG: PorT family protein [Chryseobacterium sp.]|jgi:hypothetical protein|uniref:porin family protein n=1 Tax=Chryseobacterium sp. TaxID=1871047 RepID=UPI002828ADCD|nr:porin family protein [Chryseobacterium sp.]MDR2234709.1 PorT family protein [Chryseobacterium sp.]
MNNRWLNDLRRKMEDHEEDVPDGLWDEIRDELFPKKNGKIVPLSWDSDSEDTGKTEQAPVGKKNSWLYRTAGIAAAVVLLFFAGKFLLDRSGEKENSQYVAVDSGKRNPGKSKGDDVVKSDDQSITEDGRISGPEMHIAEKEMVSEKTWTDNIFRNIFENTNKKDNLNTEKTTVSDGWPQENKPTPAQSYASETNQENKEDAKEEIPVPAEDNLPEKYAAHNQSKVMKKPARKSWMLSMLTGNASSNSSEQQFSGYASMSGSPMMMDEVWSATSVDDDPLTEILLANQSKEVEARIRHKVPVTFGLSLYYNLGKRWGIGTGVNYTKLSSELHSGTSSSYIKGDQTVHYIGIPVQVNYNVIKKGRFTGYITGGMLAEKPVAGNLKTQYIVNDEVKESSEERLHSKPIQFSVNTAAGLQLKIIDKFGVYAEPGIGYHFKDNSGLNTIYKEKPLHFNVKFGVRLMLD